MLRNIVFEKADCKTQEIFLQRYRYAAIVVIMLYPLWNYIYKALYPDCYDSMGLRLLAILPFLIYLPMSYKSQFIRKYSEEIFCLGALFVTASSFMLISQNNFGAQYLVGHLTVVAGYSLFIDSVSILIIYNFCAVIATLFIGGDYLNPAKHMLVGTNMTLAICSYFILLQRNQLLQHVQKYTLEFMNIATIFPDSFFRLNAKGEVIQIHRREVVASGPLHKVRIGEGFAMHVKSEIAVFFLPMLDRVVKHQHAHTETLHFNYHGREYYYEFRIFPLEDEEYFLVIRDTTALTHSQHKKEEEQARVMQSSKYAAIGEMAGIIFHEIGNALNIISLLPYKIKKLASSKSLDEDLIEISGNIDQGVNRIVQTMDSMRTIMRVSKTESLEKISLCDVVNEVISLCKFRYKSKQIELINLIDPKLNCIANKVDFSEVVLNLLSNAQDAVSELEERWIKIEAHKSDDLLVISITDSGKGVPLPYRDKIMESFFTTRLDGKGTGLGLSIVKKIVEKHGGKFYLDTQSERTRFVIELTCMEEK